MASVLSGNAIFWVLFTDGSFSSGSQILYMSTVSDLVSDWGAMNGVLEKKFTNKSTVAPAPLLEPGVMGLLAVGLAGLVLRRKVA